MATVNWDVFFLRVYIPRRRESNMFHGILYACKGMRLRDDEEGYDVCSDDDDRTDEDRDDDDDDDYDDGAPKLAAISRGLIAFSLCSISKEKNPWKKMLDIRKKTLIGYISTNFASNEPSKEKLGELLALETTRGRHPRQY